MYHLIPKLKRFYAFSLKKVQSLTKRVNEVIMYKKYKIKVYSRCDGKFFFLDIQILWLSIPLLFLNIFDQLQCSFQMFVFEIYAIICFAPFSEIPIFTHFVIKQTAKPELEAKCSKKFSFQERCPIRVTCSTKKQLIWKWYHI